MTNDSLNPIPQDLNTYLAEIEAENHQGDVSAKDIARMVAIIRHLQRREIPVIAQARDAAQKAIIDFLNVFPGWIVARENERSHPYYRADEATHVAWSVYLALIPYLRTTEPVFVGQDDHDSSFNGYERRKPRPLVSLEKCAIAIHEYSVGNKERREMLKLKSFQEMDEHHQCTMRNQAKVVLDAAQVKYE
jgi:hypothetical protein